MFKSVYAKLVVIMLSTSVWFCGFNIQPARASGTIYIRADGSIDPSTAPIQPNGNVYTLTDNITTDADGIVAERDNIVIDGAGFTLQGTGTYWTKGIDLSGRNNVTIRDTNIRGFDRYGAIWLEGCSFSNISGNNLANNYYGIYLFGSANNTVSGNKLINNSFGIWLEYSSGNILKGNIMTDNISSFSVRGDSLSSFVNHVDVSNTVNGKPIYYWINVHDATVPLDAGYVALVNSTRVTVHNLNLTESGREILLAYTLRTTITLNEVALIDVYSSSDNTLSGNNIHDGGGIYLRDSSNNIVNGNSIANGTDGINLDDSSNNSVSGNNIMENDYYGIHLWSSLNNSVGGNNITGNEYCGISLSYSTNNNVSGNSLFDNGLLVSYSSYSIDRNVISDNLVNGKPLVYLDGVSDRYVEDAGQVVLVRCSHIRVQNLDLSNATVGVQLWQTNDTEITANNIANGQYGIFLEDSSNNIIGGNNLTTNNREGILLVYSSNNSINGNNITNSYVDIDLGWSSNNNIRGNNIARARNTGVYLSGSNNSIFHNNFIDNPRQVYVDSEYVNFWDDSCEGNYWSDYGGTAFDKYGIGHDPHIINDNNTDHFPLMNPYLSGDMNHDAKVNIVDITMIATAFASQLGETKWNPHADLDRNGKINIVDITTAAKEFGKEWKETGS